RIFGKSGGSLPENRASLYQGFVDYIYEYNREERRVGFAHTKYEIENFLSGLGFKFQCKNVVSLEEKDISEIKEMKADCERLGLICFFENGVKFSPHQTFQEYFAARRLKELDEDEVDISVTFEHPRWKETILFLSGLIDNSTELIKKIKKKDIFLAAECIGQAKKIDDSVKNEIITSLHRLAKDRYTHNRIRAIECLGLIEGDNSIGVLLEALKDEWEVGEETVSAFVRLKAYGKVKGLIGALGDKDKDVREKAADALGQIGDKTATKPLIKALGDEDSYVRGQAACALGQIGDKTATKPLIKALGDEDGYVRGKAAEALGMIGDKEAVQPLIKALGDEDSYVRGQAA
ncbi:MAG: HEAT repeat domain-containing protein, partial [Candidatus Desantisbacteria bacterium]